STFNGQSTVVSDQVTIADTVPTYDLIPPRVHLYTSPTIAQQGSYPTSIRFTATLKPGSYCEGSALGGRQNYDQSTFEVRHPSGQIIPLVGIGRWIQLPQPTQTTTYNVTCFGPDGRSASAKTTLYV